MTNRSLSPVLSGNLGLASKKIRHTSLLLRGVLGTSAASLLLAGASCAPTSSPDSSDSDAGDGDGSRGDGDGDGNGSGGGNTDIDIGEGTGGDTNPGNVCGTATAEATLTSEPVDIILVLDNSGSMADELEAVEQNINVNFANILEGSQVDYRLILISRHRIEDRSASESASTSICVEQPLSGLPACPSPFPILSPRFYQYSIKIESTDSFDRILGTYNLPDDKYDLTLVGWHEWLRPEAKKVFLELTDDNEDMPVDTFLTSLSNLSTEHFGTPEAPTFTFHSIVGIKEKANPADPYLPSEPVEVATCTGNGNVVENAGESYQDLSIRTGGLRFPLCEFGEYDTVFSTIAADVVTKASVACDFEIPPLPEGLELETDKVAVSHVTTDASVQFGQALTPADCQDNAFYILDNRIWLCPTTCEAVRANTSIDSRVDVLFTCDSTIIVK